MLFKICFTSILVLILSCSSKENNIKNEKVDTLKVVCDTIEKSDSNCMKNKLLYNSTENNDTQKLIDALPDYFDYDDTTMRNRIKKLKESILLEEIDTLKKYFKNIPYSIGEKGIIEKYYKNFDKDGKIPVDRNYSKKIRNFLRGYFQKNYNILLDTQNVDKQLNDSLIKNN